MKRVAVIGAGPLGLEAALYARRLGHEVALYERDTVAENVRRWGHVLMFSPWRMNISPLARSELRRRGWSAPDPEAFPTGRQFRENYLLPLSEVLDGALRTGVEVAGVARSGLLKNEAVGGNLRSGRSFRLLLRPRGQKEEWAEADVVIDASGVFGNPAALGHGGLPAPGETAVGAEIDRGPPDVLGAERPRFAGKTVLVLGAGHSAATSVVALARLQAEERATRILWCYRSERQAPLNEVTDDPLPGRSGLAREANRLARERPGGLDVARGVMVEAIERSEGRFRIALAGPGGRRECVADRIIACAGYRPDHSLSRELQAHFCYASEGSQRLAAKLLGTGTDCLAVPKGGPDLLRHPEPDFFVIGQKSYGRSGAFLIANGREAIRYVFRLVDGEKAPDLYAEPL